MRHCCAVRRFLKSVAGRQQPGQDENAFDDETMMSRETISTMCRALPGAEWSDPWGGGHEAWKIGGKMFACIGATMPGVAVKTDSIETAQMLIEAGIGVKAPYFHRSWIKLPFDAPHDELEHRLRASYRLVRQSLPRKQQTLLPPWE
jgi:predicted DNA-binding protein (MmcQ/YjbR family)